MASRTEASWAVGQVDEEVACFVCGGLVDGPGGTKLDFGLVHRQCMQCHVCRRALTAATCHVGDKGWLSCGKHCHVVRNSMFLAPSFLRTFNAPQPQKSASDHQIHPSTRPHNALVGDSPKRMGKAPPPPSTLNHQVRQLEHMAAAMNHHQSRGSTRHSMGIVYEASLPPYAHGPRHRKPTAASAPDITVGPTGKVTGLHVGHVRLADAGMGPNSRGQAAQPASTCTRAQGTPARAIVMAEPDGQAVVVVPRHRRTATPVPSELQADRSSSMQAREVQQEMMRALDTYIESPGEGQATPCRCRQAVADSRRGSVRKGSVHEPSSPYDTPMVTACPGWVVETVDSAQPQTAATAGRPQGVHVLEDEAYFGRHFKGQSPALYGATCNGQPIILALLASPTTINRAMLLTAQHTVCGYWAPQALAATPDRVTHALDPTLPLSVAFQPLQAQAEASLAGLESSLAVPGYKFGVLYASHGQVDEEAIFSNTVGSKAFDEFLSCLGTTVALLGYAAGYKGGLDTKHNTTGTHSVVATYQEKSVMFHVSTLLPHTPNCKQQLQRKRHIGNDMVAVVFVDGTTPFNPGCIPSHFLHGYVVVQPMRQKDSDIVSAYRMATVYRDTVHTHQPRLPHGTVQSKGPTLAKTLLEKLIALETAVHSAPAFQRLTERTRDQLLRDMLTHAKTDGDIVRKRSNMKRLSATAATFRLSAMPMMNLSATIMRPDTAADTQQRTGPKPTPHFEVAEPAAAPSLPPTPTMQSLPLPSNNTSTSTLPMEPTPSGPLPTHQNSFKALAMRLTRNSPLARFMAPKDRSKKPVEVVA